MRSQHDTLHSDSVTAWSQVHVLICCFCHADCLAAMPCAVGCLTSCIGVLRLMGEQEADGQTHQLKERRLAVKLALPTHSVWFQNASNAMHAGFTA